jgi:hypothetical protein
LSSLSKTIADDIPVMIFQDGIENKDKILYLEGQEVLLDDAFPLNIKWLNKIGKLDNKETAKYNYKYPYKIASPKTLGVVNNCLWATRTLFEFDTDMVYLVQDDIIFKEGWYDKLIEIGKSRDDWGIICGCSLGKFELPDGVHIIDENSKDFLRMQLYLIHRRILPILQGGYIRKDGGWSDYYFCRRTREGGFKTLLVRPAVAQHIGFRSECHPKCGKDETATQVDESASLPYVI